MQEVLENKMILVNVNGESMNRLLQKGDEVYCKKVCNYRFGDIIVLKYQEDFYIHRIIFRICDFIIQTGDNSLRCAKVKKKDIIAKAMCIKNNEMTDLQNRKLNCRCAFIDIKLMLILSLFRDKMSLIRTPFWGKIYLQMISKRNKLQEKYFSREE